MEKEIYTPMEKVLVQSALYAESLETKKKLAEAAALDLMLLEMEEKMDLMDGLAMEVYLL